MAGGGGKEQNYWPGFVDALSNLVLVVILVLVVFTLALFFFASRVGAKVTASAAAKAQEVVAMAAAAQTQAAGAPEVIEKPETASDARKKEKEEAAVEAMNLLQEIQQDLDEEQKKKFQQKIAMVEEKFTGAPEVNNNAEADVASEMNKRSELIAEKNISEAQKGVRLLPGRQGMTNNEVTIVTYGPGVVELDLLVTEGLDKAFAGFNSATMKVELVAQPSPESFSEAQRLSYYRLVGLRNYLLRKGVGSDRVVSSIVERPANPEIKPGAVFVRVVK